MKSAIHGNQYAPCVIGHDPVVTLRREALGAPPQLRIEIGSDSIAVDSLNRQRDSVADITWYRCRTRLMGRATVVCITVNCGAPQPYFELTGRLAPGVTTYRVSVPITHEEQDHILALADPLSEVGLDQSAIAV